jgi:4-amino-4-deoxy-L-arabinose transferase-like glycosyltransferase
MTASSRGPAAAAFVGAVVAALVTLPALGAGTLWDNSETAYGEVAREILLTHDWLVMHSNGLPYFVQPPLYFWIAALFASVLGTGTFALRLPSALATIFMGGATGYTVARQAGTRAGIYASVILSSCLMQAVIGRLAIMDALLDLAVTLTIFAWFRGLQTGRGREIVYGWIAAAFGTLAKGPVALVIALLVIVPFALWNRRRETLSAPPARAWAIGAIVFCAIVAPWPLLVVARYGTAPVAQLIGHYTVGRYTGVIENQSGPIWYYLPVVFLGFFPWIAFLPMALVYGIRGLRAGTQRAPEDARLLRLGFVWAVVPLLFFSFARTKLPNYIALEFPALALLTALYFEAVTRKGGTRSAAISAATVPIAIGALALAIFIFSRNNKLTADVTVAIPGFLAMAAAIFAGSVLTALLAAREGTVRAAPYALAAATLVAMDAMAIAVLPHAEAYKPIPRLAAIIDRKREPGDRVAIQDVSGANALLFYTRPPVEELASPGDRDDDALDPRRAICAAKRIWVIAPAIRPSYDPTYGRTRRLVAVDAKAALFLYEGPRCRPREDAEPYR